MGDIHVYLENGFENDTVTISTGDEEHIATEVSTRYQVGLASVVELDVQATTPALVRIEVPEKGLTTEAQVDPAATPYVRVNITDGSLDVQQQAAPPMLA